MIKIGVIGLGERLGWMVKVFSQVGVDAKVVGVVDPNKKLAQSRLEGANRDAVFYPNLKTLVSKACPDALMIGTRCNLHTPYAIEAAAYDIPLFLEKPVATSMDQAMALEKAYSKSKNPVVVSFPLRVSTLCRMMREQIEKGAVGRVEHILGVNYVPYGTIYFDAAYRDYAITQGLFLQKAAHDFDYMMYLADAPITRISAMALKGRVFGGTKKPGLMCSQCDEQRTCLESPENRKMNGSGGNDQDHPCVYGRDLGTPADGMNEDASSALFEFANGAQGVYTQVFFTRRDAGTRGATISGHLGTLSFDWNGGVGKYVRHHKPFTDTIKTPEGGAHFGGDSELIRNFSNVIVHGEQSHTPMRAGLQSVYACLAAKESAEKGIFVKVRQVGKEI